MNLIVELCTLLALPDILSRVDNIEEILLHIEEGGNDDELEKAVSLIKSAIQDEAQAAWLMQNGWGLLAMATGTGKSKIPINYMMHTFSLLLESKIKKVLLVVPTEKLRDENWKEEFKKWEAEKLYDVFVDRTCYASLNKIENEHYDLVIGDEFHNTTENNAVFFANNKVDKLIALTATEPTDPVKVNLLKNVLKLPTVYEVPLDIAVRLRLVSPYDITIVECRLDDNEKIIPAGSKASPFMTTEKKAYDYKSETVKKVMYSRMPKKDQILKFRILDRMRFIKTLPSKTKSAIFILKNIIPEDARRLIFCGGIPQADELSPYSFHSKSTGVDYLEQFKQEQVNELAVVDAVNEGHNIPNVDWLLIAQLMSSEKDLIQRLGRGIRYRAGHTCKVIILVVVDSVDEDWLNKAIANLDKSKIKRVRYSNLLVGNTTL